MQQQFEDIFKQINAAASNADLGPDAPPPTDKASSTAAASSAAPGEASFQDTIRATMERMQNSGDQATAAAASGSGGADDFMAEMLKSLGSGDLNLEGGEDGEDFSKMLMGMMEQLTNKEILYEPMKELHDKFPEWIQKNKASTPEVDMQRYETQQKLVQEIVGKFEESTYKDSNPADREYIVDRMQKVWLAHTTCRSKS
jgi:peroxin-19